MPLTLKPAMVRRHSKTLPLIKLWLRFWKRTTSQYTICLKNCNLVSGHPTVDGPQTALVRVTSDLLAADQGIPSLLTLLDLTAAFDTVAHNVLLRLPSKEPHFTLFYKIKFAWSIKPNF